MTNLVMIIDALDIVSKETKCVADVIMIKVTCIQVRVIYRGLES